MIQWQNDEAHGIKLILEAYGSSGSFNDLKLENHLKVAEFVDVLSSRIYTIATSLKGYIK